ncbi:HBR234Wp [Eremothecium sinecaudum]|uniref:HBR234Wp n=1 Tax=Eremothecium sinecaudum TaxID=45286 RepID=A0A125RE14_9SACH|nr:HBR234Wp [Eremothecium sinecaudum]AMD19135.1 HBR234Wp [Eremothecium sinecaudum]
MSQEAVNIVFEKVIATVHLLSASEEYNTLPRPPTPVQLQLYGYYKQATEGDVALLIEKPSADCLNPESQVALTKWEAWNARQGLSSTEAKREYTRLFLDTLRTCSAGNCAVSELSDELEFLWWQVSNFNEHGREGGPESVVSCNSIPDSKTQIVGSELYRLAVRRERLSSANILNDRTKAAYVDKLSKNLSNHAPSRPKKLIWILLKCTSGLIKGSIQYAAASLLLLILLKVSSRNKTLELSIGNVLGDKMANDCNRSYLITALCSIIRYLNSCLREYRFNSLYLKIS